MYCSASATDWIRSSCLIEAGLIEAGPIEAGPIEAGPIEAGWMDVDWVEAGLLSVTAAAMDRRGRQF